MKSSTDIAARISAFAPLLVVALLATMPLVLPNMTRFNPQSEVRKAELRSAIDDLPYFIGDWVGTDVDIPREAQQLLKPNASLSRTYEGPGGAEVHVVLVHCSDARDMIGHYPPVCYPSSGWISMEPERASDMQIEAGELRLPVRLYRFKRLREQGDEDQIRIFNAFVLPDGTVTREIDDINRQSERLAVSVQGVAQLQLLTSAAMTHEEAVAAAGELVQGMRDLLDALRVGEGAGGDA